MTPYDILSVTPSTPFEDIKRMYRRLAQKYHPDKSAGNEEYFKKVKLAFEWIESHYGEPIPEATMKPKTTIQEMGPIAVKYSHYIHGFYFRKHDATFESCVGYDRINVQKKYRYMIAPAHDDAWRDKIRNPYLIDVLIHTDGNLHFTFEPSAWHYALGYPMVLVNDLHTLTVKNYKANTWIRLNNVPGYFNQNVYFWVKKPSLNWLQRLVRKLFD